MINYAIAIKEYRHKKFLIQEEFEPTMKMKKILNKLFVEAGLSNE